MPLNAQELRNCIYRGPYNDLLHSLSSDPDYMKIMGFKGPEKRMKDVEYVLRFASFWHSSYLNYKQSMETFMNEDMKKYQQISPLEADQLRAAFKNAVTLIWSLLGKNAFKRFYRVIQTHTVAAGSRRNLMHRSMTFSCGRWHDQTKIR